jgi:hypothetical protein
MHKKFEEFVLGWSDLDSMDKSTNTYCPSELGLENKIDPLTCKEDSCGDCWGHAEKQWLKGQPMKTTNQSPTEEGFYWAREKSRKTGKWGEWQVIQWEGEELHTIGWDVPELWHSEWWERSVGCIQMPGEKSI